MGKGVAPRTQTTEAVDLVAIAAVTAALAILAVRVWRGVDDTPSGALSVVLMLAAGYLLADLLTGFVHWF